jgi:hypothetical protein
MTNADLIHFPLYACPMPGIKENANALFESFFLTFNESWDAKRIDGINKITVK